MKRKVKAVLVRMRNIVADESGISGVVVAAALIIMAGLGLAAVYVTGLKPTVLSAGGIGGAMQTSGATAAKNWAGVQ